MEQVARLYVVVRDHLVPFAKGFSAARGDRSNDGFSWCHAHGRRDEELRRHLFFFHRKGQRGRGGFHLPAGWRLKLDRHGRTARCVVEDRHAEFLLLSAGRERHHGDVRRELHRYLRHDVQHLLFFAAHPRTVVAVVGGRRDHGLRSAGGVAHRGSHVRGTPGQQMMLGNVEVVDIAARAFHGTWLPLPIRLRVPRAGTNRHGVHQRCGLVVLQGDGLALLER